MLVEVRRNHVSRAVSLLPAWKNRLSSSISHARISCRLLGELITVECGLRRRSRKWSSATQGRSNGQGPLSSALQNFSARGNKKERFGSTSHQKTFLPSCSYWRRCSEQERGLERRPCISCSLWKKNCKGQSGSTVWVNLCHRKGTCGLLEHVSIIYWWPQGNSLD